MVVPGTLHADDEPGEDSTLAHRERKLPRVHQPQPSLALEVQPLRTGSLALLTPSTSVGFPGGASDEHADSTTSDAYLHFLPFVAEQTAPRELPELQRRDAGGENHWEWLLGPEVAAHQHSVTRSRNR